MQLTKHVQPVGVVLGAEQDAVVPPLVPEQDQFQGPEPVTEVGFPDEHNADDGALVRSTPFAEPQAPFTGAAPQAPNE